MNTKPQPQHELVLKQVTVEGLDSDAVAPVEGEVRNLFELVRKFKVEMRSPIEISVNLTADIATAVDQFNAEHGIQSPAYNRSRPQGTSCGITLTVPEDSEVTRYTIVMDATLWSAQSPDVLVYRTHGLAYLLGYIINQYDTSRIKPSPPEFEGEYAESLWHSAWNLCLIYEDSIFATDVCKHLLHDQDGNPPGLADYFGNQKLLTASELLDQICVFTTIDIGLYLGFEIGQEDLYETGTAFSAGLLQITIEAIVLFGTCDRFDELHQRLSRMNGFPEFLEPIWPDVITGCVSGDYSSRVQGFVAAFTTLFERLGLRIEDMEEGGLYIHVHEPVACSWIEGNGQGD